MAQVKEIKNRAGSRKSVKVPEVTGTAIRSSFENAAQAIRKRAYEIYEKRGSTHGMDWNDWFSAEKEILGNSQVLN